MRIVQAISRSGCSSGGSIQALLLAKALKDLGHRVLFVSRGGDCERRAVELGVEHASNPMGNNPADLARFALLCRKADVIHAHKGRALFYALFAKLVAGGIRVFANRGVSFPLEWGNRWKYRLSDGVVCVSFGIVRDLAREGLDPRRLRVVYGSVDGRFFGAAPCRIPGLEDGDFAVLLVGNFRPWKGHLILAEAASRLLDRAKNLTLVFAGKEKKSLLEQVRNRFEGKLISLGYRRDVERVMAASQILVNASTEGEGVPGVLREAMAVGVCVVASSLEGNREMIEHKKNGYLFGVGRAEELSALLEKLFHNPKLRMRAAVNGKRYATRFTLENRARAMLRVYGG